MINEMLQKETLTAVESALRPMLAQIAMSWGGLHIERRDTLLCPRAVGRAILMGSAEPLGEGLLELAVERGYLEQVSGSRCPRKYNLTKLGRVVAESHPLMLQSKQTAMLAMVKRNAAA